LAANLSAGQADGKLCIHFDTFGVLRCGNSCRFLAVIAALRRCKTVTAAPRRIAAGKELGPARNGRKIDRALRGIFRRRRKNQYTDNFPGVAFSP
jgi:hypothetical protein